MATRGRKPAAAKKTTKGKLRSPIRNEPERIETLIFTLVNRNGKKLTKKITEEDEILLDEQIAKMIYNQLEDGHIVDSQRDGSKYIVSIGFNPSDEATKDWIGEQIVDVVDAQDNRTIFLKYEKEEEENKPQRKKVSPAKHKQPAKKRSVSPPKKKEETPIIAWMFVLSYVHDDTPMTDLFMIPEDQIETKLKKILLNNNMKSINEVVVDYYKLNPGLKFKSAKLSNITLSNAVTELLDSFYPYLIDKGNNKTYVIREKVNLTAKHFE